jgi:hypothetical protein
VGSTARQGTAARRGLRHLAALVLVLTAVIAIDYGNATRATSWADLDQGPQLAAVHMPTTIARARAPRPSTDGLAVVALVVVVATAWATSLRGEPSAPRRSSARFTTPRLRAPPKLHVAFINV